MASSIPRPVPIGLNQRGGPLWDGSVVRAFRVAHGVPQGEVALRLGMTSPAVSTLFETDRAPISQRYDRIEQYCQAVERAAGERKRNAAEALAFLRKATVS